MKPFFEQIKTLPDRSYFLRYQESPLLTMPFHYHPEVELTYNLGNQGKRFIGNSVERLEECDVVFLGANLPHAFISDAAFEHAPERQHCHAYVLQFMPAVLGNALELPELQGVRGLLALARQGMVFHGHTSKRLVALMEAQYQAEPLRAYVLILEMLELMAHTKEYRLLSTKGFIKEYHAPDYHRLNVVYNYIVDHFREELSLAQVAAVASMSETAFCRFLKKRTLKTFGQLVTEMRISYACSLLKKGTHTVQQVAEEAGFNNLSNFNRQFKKVMGHTPLAYAKEFR